MSDCPCRKLAKFLVSMVEVVGESVLLNVHEHCPDCNKKIHPDRTVGGAYYNYHDLYDGICPSLIKEGRVNTPIKEKDDE